MNIMVIMAHGFPIALNEDVSLVTVPIKSQTVDQAVCEWNFSRSYPNNELFKSQLDIFL